MQTQSHVLINAAFGKQLERRGIRPKYWALGIGSFMPDIPLTILTINYIMKTGGFGRGPEEVFGQVYDTLYFTDPVWVIGHALFHAPLMIALWMLIGWWVGFRQDRQWGKWVFWFAVGNALHSALDIPTHHHDGPLLLFPFNWEVRFISPVSYWDPNHYGNIFAPIELGLNGVLIVYFIWDAVSRRMRRSAAKAQNQGEVAAEA
jgi:membrane-bound metal-dependent hydrolase YbcI (DUF457 family)